MTAAAGRPPAGLFASVVAAAVLAGATLAGQQTRPPANVAGEWHFIVLGIAQDGGIRTSAASRRFCRSIREGRRKPERVASLGLLDTALGKEYLFDATPDFKSQLQTLTGGHPPDGIFLTWPHRPLHRVDVPRPRVDRRAARARLRHGEDEGLSHDEWAVEPAGLRGNIDLQVVEPDTPVALEDGDSRYGVHGAASRRVHGHRRLSHRRPAQEGAVHSGHRSVAEVVARHP